MTPKRIAELRALCEKATPGPWYESMTYTPSVFPKDSTTAVAFDLLKTDMNFIAAARTAVPELLDEIERVQKQRDTIVEVHNAYVEQGRGYAERLARECLFSDSDKSVSEIIAAAKARIAGENNV